LAAFLLLLSFIAQASLERFLIDEELVHLKTQARPINKAIKDALPANRTYADLASDLAWQVAGPEVIVYLLDTQGHVLAASKGADALDPLAGDCYKRALARERDVSQIVHAMGSSAPRWLAYCHWVHVDELNFGVAYLAKSLARTDALLQEVRGMLVGTTVAIVIVAMLVGIPLSALAVQPLMEVARTARRISEGDLSQRLPAQRGSGELAQLADTFNTMLDRLAGTIAELARLNELNQTLVQEMHHRIKNNLATVADLLELELLQGHERSIEASLADSVARIKTIAAVHEFLSMENTTDADARWVIRRVLDACPRGAAPLACHVETSVAGESLMLPSHQATALALVVNELVNNASMHAFHGRANGRVDVSIQHDGPEVCVAVQDNGVGLPEGFNLDTSPRLGLRIARTLVEKDLGGRLSLASDEGTTAIVRFVP